jgi:sigma-B regulation protein RsbU (phosphoserine phosphatase)
MNRMTEETKKGGKLHDKLSLLDFKLNSLLDITKAINSNYSTEKLLDIYKFILKEQLGITKLMLFTFDNNWVCILKYGIKASSKEINVKNDLTKIKEITVIESSSKDYLNSFDVVIPVFHKESPLAYLLIGDLDEDELKISPTIKHMPFIQTLTNIIVVAIENKRLAKEGIKQELIKKELQVASEMQALLLPDNLPSDSKVDIAALYKAHQQVGGDYYDYIPVDEDEFVFCISDVSGKGISAALLMANFQANLRALIKYTNYSLSKIVEELNASVTLSAKGEKFITLFIARYNIISRKLTYINCGHNHPVFSTGKEVRYLVSGTTGLGMVDELPAIEEAQLYVPANSMLLCYTDGLTEIENEDNESFSMEKLIETIHKNYDHKMARMNELIFEAVDKHRGKAPFFDDTALFSVRFY